MNDDPMEGTSELFASLLGDVSQEQWESFKAQQNKLGMFVVNSDEEDDSDGSDRSLSPCGDDEFTANIELIEQDDELHISEASEDEETGKENASWAWDAALKYANGEIDFTQLNDMIEDAEPKGRPRKKVCLEKDQKERKVESQLEKEDKEYQMELKNRKRKRRKRIFHLPKELEGLMGAANLNFAKGNTEDAIKMCMELIRLAPNAQEPFQTLSVIYDELGDQQKSFQYALVAAYLNPSDTEEWIRLAEISIDQNLLEQAISCFTRAIRNEPTNVNLIWERCNLYEQLGKRKMALFGYELILKNLSNPDDGEKCVEMAREIAKVHHDNTDYANAIKVLDTAFTKFPSLITSEDVNFLLELQMLQKLYKAAVKTFIQHCGVKLYMQGQEINSVESYDSIKDNLNSVENCYIPEVLPIDLSVKILICLIHLKATQAIEPLIKSLLEENPEDIGDLYLDVAEAFMDIGDHNSAKTLLFRLLSTTNYNLPAVWMKYADCLNALSKSDEATEAYLQVIKMAPSYEEARLALSKIYLGMGKVQEATNILRQEYEDGGEGDGTVLGITALYERCRLLEAEGRWEEFIRAGTLLQYSHCFKVETEEEFGVIIANQTYKRRNEALRDLKAQSSKILPEFIGQNISVTDMWDIFKKISQKLVDQQRFEELQKLSLAALSSTMFMKNPEMSKEVEFQALLSCYYSQKYYYAYLLVKELVVKNLHNNKVWNLFGLIVTRSQETRHNRFCLRLMMKHQDHLALGYLNGHNAMISGTYKHALGEYMCILKERPHDPFVTFCVGITFIHMACQKFATKRHFLTIQGFAFLIEYLKLKGECQETLYNVGRALHQLGIKDAAVHYYKKALCVPLRITDEEQDVFDLKREIAYNLCLIYQSTGAMDLAYMYTRKYIVI